MQAISFCAQDNLLRSVRGSLIIGENTSKIVFDTVLSNYKDLKIQQTNIKNVNNFIASIIARLDKEEYFDSVEVNGVDTKIIRNKIETKTVYVVGEYENKIGLDSDLIETTDHLGNKVTVKVPSTPVEVPVDGKYTRDPILNKVLSDNFMPVNYDRRINNKILQLVRGIKQGSRKAIGEVIHLDRYANTTGPRKAVMSLRISDFKS